MARWKIAHRAFCIPGHILGGPHDAAQHTHLEVSRAQHGLCPSLSPSAPQFPHPEPTSRAIQCQ